MCAGPGEGVQHQGRARRRRHGQLRHVALLLHGHRDDGAGCIPPPRVVTTTRGTATVTFCAGDGGARRPSPPAPKTPSTPCSSRSSRGPGSWTPNCHLQAWATVVRRVSAPGTRLVFGLLLMAGTLIQACSDNNGSTGPTFACREDASNQSPTRSGSVRLAESCTATPAPVVGDGTGGARAESSCRSPSAPAPWIIGRRASVLVIGDEQERREADRGARRGPDLDVSGAWTPRAARWRTGCITTTIFLPCEVAPADRAAWRRSSTERSSDADGGSFSAVTATVEQPLPVERRGEAAAASTPAGVLRAPAAGRASFRDELLEEVQIA